VKNRNAEPLVSIIIPVYNSQQTIQRCLQSIADQTYKKIETIIVDRYSSDKTIQIAKQFNVKILRLNSERSLAKNFGAKKSSGKFLLFMDSDMELHPKTVEECIVLCNEKNFDAVMIPETTIAYGFWARCRKHERDFYNNDSNFFLMPRFFNKKSFLNVQGFDERLVLGEDFDLARRYEKRGYHIGVATLPIKHIEGKLALTKVILKAYYYGKSFVPFFFKNPTLTLRGYSPTRFVRNIKFLLKQPAYLFGILVIKLLEYVSYAIGVFAYVLSHTIFLR